MEELAYFHQMDAPTLIHGAHTPDPAWCNASPLSWSSCVVLWALDIATLKF